MSDPTAEILEKDDSTPSTIDAILQTRCGSSRIIEIPVPFPRTITMELAPIPNDEKGIRVFYYSGKSMEIKDQGKYPVYYEGPIPAPKIIVPGLNPGRKSGLILP